MPYDLSLTGYINNSYPIEECPTCCLNNDAKRSEELEHLVDSDLPFPEHKENILAYYDRWEEMLNGPISGTVDLFRNLKEDKSLKIYALTNWSAETFPRALELFNFLHWFDGRIVSGEENTRKPHKEIYELIINRFSLNKEETIFIDDNLRNISAAEEFGIKSIHFKSPELLKSSLQDLHLL